MNRWLYMSVVFVVPVVLSALSEFEQQPLYLLSASLVAAVLTYPLGVLGQLISLPLIYFGLATTTEALAVAGPVVALLGYVQWYVLLPRLAKRVVARQQER